MGIKELRQAFSDELGPGYSVTSAFLKYERHPDPETGKLVEWQMLTFHGSKPDGTAFDVKADLHSPNADPVVVARETASEFLKKQG